MAYHKEDRIDKLPALFNAAPKTMGGFVITKMQEFYSSRRIINGLKLTLEGETRWLLLRASKKTEPLIRIYSEAQSNEEVNKIAAGKELFI